MVRASLAVYLKVLFHPLPQRFNLFLFPNTTLFFLFLSMLFPPLGTSPPSRHPQPPSISSSALFPLFRPWSMRLDQVFSLSPTRNFFFSSLPPNNGNLLSSERSSPRRSRLTELTWFSFFSSVWIPRQRQDPHYALRLEFFFFPSIDPPFILALTPAPFLTVVLFPCQPLRRLRSRSRHPTKFASFKKFSVSPSFSSLK